MTASGRASSFPEPNEPLGCRQPVRTMEEQDGFKTRDIYRSPISHLNNGPLRGYSFLRHSVSCAKFRSLKRIRFSLEFRDCNSRFRSLTDTSGEPFGGQTGLDDCR